jgi:hypothetical protein
MSSFARFLFKGDVNSEREIKPSAIMPPKNNPATSVLLDSDMPINEVWVIGKCVERVRERNSGHKRALIGKGGMAEDEIKNLGLDLRETESECFPSKRHHDIIRWPDDIQERKSLAEKMARIATSKLIMIEG